MRILWAEGSCHVRSSSWISSPSSEMDSLAHSGDTPRLRPSDSRRESSNRADQTTGSHRVESSDRAFMAGAHNGRRFTFNWAARECEIRTCCRWKLIVTYKPTSQQRYRRRQIDHLEQPGVIFQSTEHALESLRHRSRCFRIANTS